MGMAKEAVKVRVMRTKQSMAAACDINVIMGRYAKGAVIDHLARHGARYGDFQPQTFQEAMNIVRKAEEMFEELPSEVRKKFANSPKLMLDFLNDPENLEKARKLGLAKAAIEAPAKPEPLEVVVVGGPGAQPPAAAKAAGGA